MLSFYQRKYLWFPINLRSLNASETNVCLIFSKVPLLLLNISNALIKLFIRFLAISKPKVLACNECNLTKFSGVMLWKYPQKYSL